MKLSRVFLLVLALCALPARPAAAQSILRDAETEAWLDDLAAPLVEAAGLDPANFDVVLVNDNSLNAFVVGGQRVYIHSGTILQADNANQIQGILAHEIGHVAGGHAIRFGDEAGGTATGISILSLVAAVGAIAGGAPDAGMALMGLGQRAATGKVLAFSRQQEARTDLAGSKFLETAGISAKGYLQFYEKLENQEFRYAVPQDEQTEYLRTHPSPANRIATLRELSETSPYWDTPTDPELERRFRRVQAKLFGYVENPERTLRTYPPSDRSTEAHLARAYAYHKSAYPEEAAAEADALLAENPDDPFVLELKGQVLLESGSPAEAIEPLERSLAADPNQPLIATLLGHALLSTEEPERVDRAVAVLREAVRQDRNNPFAWYQLGIAYSRQGDEARASLATAEQQALSRQPGLAVRSARMAMDGIEKGTPDWLRAQDILLVAQAQMEDERRR
ncbi:peptidase M48 [Pacificimonas flava]|uniref:Peptidase M48 n=2 Tax=Pacificimonas TaxID=1960290 RepID=A0A219B5H6_9SPHN|nr:MULTISPECIES: M48 family metalloprotease [Pacificimonas]MBZ6379155.1 M48 family metalloprotease [Pacificimonas aurantium]OWV33620.1 peptidase M48 [Pacificimonas flava]